MREAFGGEFMLKLMLVFIVIYVGFAAVSFSYAKAFRVKNKVISYLEENDIHELNQDHCDNALGEIIANSQYLKSCNDGNGEIEDPSGVVVGFCCNGVVIEKQETPRNYIYRVTTYADWNLGGLNMITKFGSHDEVFEGSIVSNYHGDPRNLAVNGTFKISGKAYVRKGY